MIRDNKALAVFFAAFCAGIPFAAHANPDVMADACATTDPGITGLFDATAFLLNVHVQTYQKNLDGTYAISMGTYTTSPEGPLDPSSAYYGQPQAPAGRSGVLISDNTILTSAHALPFEYTTFLYIFGLHAQNVDGNCQYPDLAHIPPENVYFPSTGSDHLYNGVVLNTYSVGGAGDFVLITLDRPVVGRTPLAVRKSGFASPTDRFAGDSFTQRLIPGKGDLAIAHTNETASTGVQVGNVSLMSGSSGSPIYNLDAGVVETVAASSNSCLDFVQQPDGLYLLEEACPGSFIAVNGPVTVISTLPGFKDADLIFRANFDQ